MSFFRVILVLICFVLAPTVAKAEPSLENKVKVAYLYNFTKFISWPEKNTESFNICILGNNPFGDLLTLLETKKAGGKPIKLYYYQRITDVQQCHILYLPDSTRPVDLAALPEVLVVRSLKNTLTVSSQPSFAEQGGMIGFILKEGRVKLQINLLVLQQQGLSISAKLLEVAEVVKGVNHE